MIYECILQVKDCLKQNEELRGIIDKLRTEQATSLTLNDKDMTRVASAAAQKDEFGDTNTSELSSLKVSSDHANQGADKILLSANDWVSFHSIGED